jgi:hypothetical protein
LKVDDKRKSRNRNSKKNFCAGQGHKANVSADRDALVGGKKLTELCLALKKRT